MTPGSFDVGTAKEMVGDARMRSTEARARADADRADLADPSAAERLPEALAKTYWGQCQEEFARAVYREAFRKRIERRIRKEGVATSCKPTTSNQGD